MDRRPSLSVSNSKSNRKDIMETVDAMKADIVDMSKNQMLIQICDRPDRTAMLIKLLNEISITEIARTGTLALPKCDN